MDRTRFSKPAELAHQHGVHRQQRLRNRLQARMPRHQLQDPPGKASALSSCRPFSPKPHSIPRRLFSMSCNLDCTSLPRGEHRLRLLRPHRFAVHRPETHPSRISWAIPRACSLRSDFTGDGFEEHHARVVSPTSSTTAKTGVPHRRIQPLRQRSASRPIRNQSQPQRAEPGDQCREARSLPSPSRTILPPASTTHTLDCSNDTSNSPCIMVHGRPSLSAWSGYLPTP